VSLEEAQELQKRVKELEGQVSRFDLNQCTYCGSDVIDGD
jgi:hypothetical protein